MEQERNNFDQKKRFSNLRHTVNWKKSFTEWLLGHHLFLYVRSRKKNQMFYKNKIKVDARLFITIVMMHYLVWVRKVKYTMAAMLEIIKNRMFLKC